METWTLTAEIREESGKGAARRLRAKGQIPAILYGAEAEPVSLSLTPKDLLRALETERGKNTVLTIQAGGQSHLAMIKDIAVHPVTYAPLHADFLRVAEDRPVDADVPFRVKGRAAGVVKGGALTVTVRTLRVRCNPGLIPSFIEVDVTPLDINDTFRVQDLQLPEGVSVLDTPQRTLVSVMSERKAAAEEGAPAAS